MTFRIGDVVKHGPTGETWVLAAVVGEEVWPAGWPESAAKASDCEPVRVATDEDHARFVSVVRRSSGYRAILALLHRCESCGEPPVE